MSEKPDEAVEMTEKPNIAGTFDVNKETTGSATNCNDKVVYLESPVKSDSDDNEYRVLKLPNGLKVFLVSNPGDKSNGDSKSGECDASQRDNNRASCPSETSTKNSKIAASAIVNCALTIDVGSFSDSAENPCIAELLSKVVLTASKKYPMPYNFKKFQKMQKGGVDAYCGTERTLLQLATQKIHLHEALNRFVNCFVEPLLKLEVVEIEKKLESGETMLTSQYELHDLVDPVYIRTKNHLFGTLASKCDENPARHLAPGRHRVLHSQSADTLLNAIEKFRERHYSAHRMIATLEGKLSLDELEEYAQTYFSQIPDNGLPPTDFTRFTFDKCFNSPEFRMIYEIQESCKLLDHRLELHWSMPSPTGVYKSKPTKYLGSILQQSGKGSLIRYLRMKNWCSDLRCSTGNTCLEPNSIFSLFRLKLAVTDEGHKNYKKILDAVYSYINLMRSEGPQQNIYEEIRKKSDRDFQCNAEYSQPLYRVPVPLTVHDYASADYLNGSNVLLEYDPAAIKQCLELMSPEKANIIVCQKKFGTRHSLSEKWEDVQDRVENIHYRKSTIPEAWINRWKNVEPLPQFQLPVIDDATIPEPDDSRKYPVKIHSDDLCEVYQLDTEFQSHSNAVRYLFCTSLQSKSAENAFMLDLFTCYLGTAAAKMLMQASCSVGVSLHGAAGFGVGVKGTVKNSLRWMETIAKRAATMADDMTKSSFTFSKACICSEYSRHLGCCQMVATFSQKVEILKMYPNTYTNGFKKILKLAFGTAMLVPSEVMLGIERSGRWSFLEKLDASGRVDFEKFKHFAKHIGDHIFVKCLAQGDYIGSEVIENVQSCIRMLKCRPALPNSLPRILVREFPPGTRCCRFQSIDNDDSTAVMNHYQFGGRSTRQAVIIHFFLVTACAPELKSLRARRNLDDYNVRPIPGLIGSYGYSLGTSKSQRETMTRVATIEATIEAYRKALNGWFRDLSTMEWEKVMTVCKRTMDPPSHNFDEVFENFFLEIKSGAYIFNRSTRDVKLLNGLSIEDLRRSMMQITSNDPSIGKLSVQAVSRREYAAGSADARQAQNQIRLNFLTNLPGEDVKPNDYFITDIAAYTRGLTIYPLTS